MEKLKAELKEKFKQIDKELDAIPCNFAGAYLWSDCRKCNGMRKDKTQPANNCAAWIPESFFGDSDP